MGVSFGLMLGGYGLYWATGMTATYLMAPRRLMRRDRGAVVVGVVLGTLIPLCGPVIAPFYAVYCRVVSRRARSPDTKAIVLPSYSYEVRFAPFTDASGSVSARLRRASSDQDRVRAVSRIAVPRGPEQYHLLGLALTDSAEEVRLLAHSVLDRQEQANMRGMMQMEEHIAAVPDAQPDIRSRLLERKAWLAWSIAHQASAGPLTTHSGTGDDADVTGLSQMRPASIFLMRALDELESHSAEEALRSLQAARARGVPEYIVGPHVAAAYFRLRRLEAVKALMGRMPSLRLSPRYGASATFWQTRVR